MERRIRHARSHALGGIVAGMLLAALVLGPACTTDEDTATPTPTADQAQLPTASPPGELPGSPASPAPGEASPRSPAPGAASEAEWTPDGIISDGEYSDSESYGDYEIHWKADETYIHIGMKARATGFVAVAFQPGDRMKDADIVLGMVVDGQVSIADMYSTGDFGPHPLDTELGGTDDIVDFGGREEGEFTTIEFKRALTTGDDYDNPLSEGVNQIIYSYSSSDSPTMKHAERGYGEITL